MRKNKCLDYVIHNPNEEKAMEDYLFRILVDINKQKAEKAFLGEGENQNAKESAW